MYGWVGHKNREVSSQSLTSRDTEIYGQNKAGPRERAVFFYLRKPGRVRAAEFFTGTHGSRAVLALRDLRHAPVFDLDPTACFFSSRSFSPVVESTSDAD